MSYIETLFSLRAKKIIVTGSSGLIGSEVVLTYLKAGATVFGIDVVPKTLKDELSDDELNRYFFFNCDVSNKSNVESIVQEIIKAATKIDVLVNCAAIDAKFDSNEYKVPLQNFESFPLDAWEKSFAVNVTGVLLVTQSVVNNMLQFKSGCIINVASSYSLVSPNQTLYGDPSSPSFRPKPVDYVATKSVIPNLTRYLATYYGANGIRSNAIAPHGVLTDHSTEFQKRFSEKSPLKRMCQVKELSGPFLLLASDSSSYMNGTTLVVDGGWTAW